jgi:hypothetical protein
VPWSLPDAMIKLRRLLLKPHPYMGGISDHQDGTIRRSLIAMHLWKQGQPVEKQTVTGATIINPRDTAYRAIESAKDWLLKPPSSDFWEFGKVTDKQLKESVRLK